MVENRINVVGLLAEKSLKEYVSKQGTPYIAGTIKVQIEPDNIQTIRLFANKTKKDGSSSAAFVALSKLMEEGVSLASCENDEGRATKVAAGLCQLNENVFIAPRGGQVISRPQISANFINTRNVMESPKATFSLEVAILSMVEELDDKEEPTGRLIVHAAFPQFGGRMGKANFIIDEPMNVQYASTHWKENDTVAIRGKIVSKITEFTREKEIEGGFGEPERETFTRIRTEYVITSGSNPYESELAFSEESVREGLVARQAYIDSLSEKKVEEDTDF